jgi:hypothetical protein
MICPSGDALSEATLIHEKALHCDVAGGVHASHANCVSSQTDNAARATSAAQKVLKGAELDEAKRLVEAHAAVPANMQHAVDCWLKLTPEQQANAYEMHGLGCTGHSVNLITEDSHKKTEPTVMAENILLDRIVRSIQHAAMAMTKGGGIKKKRLVSKRSVPQKLAFTAKGGEGHSSLKPDGRPPDVGDIMWKVSKLLATEGEHQCYYLNEHRAFELFAKMKGLPIVRLRSVKGSRQNLSVQQATRILLNLLAYLQYLHETRVESATNELVDGVWNGLRDHFVLGALRARSFVDVTFTTPIIFFTHCDVVSVSLAPDYKTHITTCADLSQITRPMLGRIMKGGRTLIYELSTLDALGRKAPPDLQFMAKNILARLKDPVVDARCA